MAKRTVHSLGPSLVVHFDNHGYRPNGETQFSVGDKVDVMVKTPKATLFVWRKGQSAKPEVWV